MTRSRVAKSHGEPSLVLAITQRDRAVQEATAALRTEHAQEIERQRRAQGALREDLAGMRRQLLYSRLRNKMVTAENLRLSGLLNQADLVAEQLDVLEEERRVRESTIMAMGVQLEQVLAEVSDLKTMVGQQREQFTASERLLGLLSTQLATKANETQSLQAELARKTTQLALQADEVLILRQHQLTLAKRLKRARGEPEESQPVPELKPSPPGSRWRFWKH